MDYKIKSLIENLELLQGASIETINNIEDELQIKLPDEMRGFFLESNGAEGFVGKSYLVIWSLEEMKEINKLSDIGKSFPKLVLFGSDGGGETYGLDFSKTNLAFVEFPSIGVSSDTIQFCGYKFHEFLQYIFDQYSNRPQI
jgi:hypothetical protein